MPAVAEPPRELPAIAAMVFLNAFAVPLTLASANVALPSIATGLALNALTLSWIPMIFLMASAMAVLIGGRLGDMLGRKRIFLLGTVAMMLASVVAASAPNGAVLLSARFLQGVSAGLIYSTQMAIVSAAYPANRRGRIIGWVLAGVYAGLACGPALGGYLVEHFSWRAVFLAHLPLSLLIVYFGAFRVRQEWFGLERQNFDYRGASIYVAAIALLCFGVSLVPSISAALVLLLGVVCMGVFFQRSRVVAHPLWNVSLFFRERVFSYSCLASLMMYTATYANAVLISLYLQYPQNKTAAYSGWIMMLQPITMALFSPLFGRLSDRIQARWLASAGMLLTAAALFALGQLHAESVAIAYILPLLLTGFGFSLFSSPNTNAIMSSVPKSEIGHAASATATMRILGQMCSMALVTMIIAWTLGTVQLEPSQYPRLMQAIRFSFTLAAGLSLIGCGLSLARGRIQH